jgi:N-methylhydantoinase A
VLKKPPAGRDLPNRRVYFSSTGWVDAPARRFEALASGEEVIGPAIVESSFTSVLIDPGARATRDRSGALVIEVH